MSFSCVEDSGTLPRPAYDVDLQNEATGYQSMVPKRH
jgi:hypothetical protein